MSKKNSNYNQSETVIIKRSSIQLAAYNPRQKDPKVVEEIKKNFKRVGYLGGIVWNSKTSNLVSGHKRLEALDLMNNYDGTNDYDIKIEKVELDDKTEREQNIFMNSPTVQGKFDYELLALMLPDIDYKMAGLDDSDLNLIVTEVPMVFQSKVTSEITEDFDKVSENYEERKQMMKDLKAEQKENIQNNWEGSPYVTLSFDDYESKAEFLHQFGIQSDQKIVKGEIIAQKFLEME